MKGNFENVWGTAQPHSQHDVQGLQIRGKQWNFLSPSVENNGSLWVSRTTYSLYFSLNTVGFLSLLHQTQLLYLSKTAKEENTKIADVSTLSEFSLLNISTSVRFNPPPATPARLITQRENLLWSRFITGERSCLRFFHFTVRHYW